MLGPHRHRHPRVRHHRQQRLPLRREGAAHLHRRQHWHQHLLLLGFNAGRAARPSARPLRPAVAVLVPGGRHGGRVRLHYARIRGFRRHLLRLCPIVGLGVPAPHHRGRRICGMVCFRPRHSRCVRLRVRAIQRALGKGRQRALVHAAPSSELPSASRSCRSRCSPHAARLLLEVHAALPAAARAQPWPQGQLARAQRLCEAARRRYAIPPRRRLHRRLVPGGCASGRRRSEAGGAPAAQAADATPPVSVRWRAAALLAHLQPRAARHLALESQGARQWRELQAHRTARGRARDGHRRPAAPQGGDVSACWRSAAEQRRRLCD
mmetsp:Transcript_26385/g.61589  ORF Transcript_26385/g.61589 Transcript_26385/m.61589 type:complete len:323 (-) Transcript_26385:33-1001(-)